jgi:hypothetical protein
MILKPAYLLANSLNITSQKISLHPQKISAGWRDLVSCNQILEIRISNINIIASKIVRPIGLYKMPQPISQEGLLLALTSGVIDHVY